MRIAPLLMVNSYHLGSFKALFNRWLLGPVPTNRRCCKFCYLLINSKQLNDAILHRDGGPHEFLIGLGDLHECLLICLGHVCELTGDLVSHRVTMFDLILACVDYPTGDAYLGCQHFKRRALQEPHQTQVGLEGLGLGVHFGHISNEPPSFSPSFIILPRIDSHE